MSLSSWMSLTRRVCFLGGAASLAAALANAQFLTSPNPPRSTPFTIGESSSSSLQGLPNESLTAPPVLHLATAVPAEGAAQPGGERHRVFSASHIAAEASGGFNAPIGNDTPYITWGGNFTVGGGLHFTPRLSLLAEYQFIDDKLPGAFVATGPADGGNAHIWSLTLDPVFEPFPQRRTGVYVTGGGGFYRKLTSFTDLVCCDFGGYPVSIVASHFSSNQGGVNFGFGITHRLAGTYGDGSMKLFTEVRYLYLKTPPVGDTNGLGTTELIPVSFGVRW